jgi:sugar fermentation stimulation protein A
MGIGERIREATFLCRLNRLSCLVRLGNRGREGLFPDAPTLRGRRHLQALTRAKGEGYEAATAFIVQRADVEGFSPNDEVAPEFGQALQDAYRQGLLFTPIDAR